jgi:acyl-coenzyme A thioesterase PaaI-like protein
VAEKPHPALIGREREAEALADVVRRLIELSVTNAAPSDVLTAVTADLDRSADQLARHVPAVPFPRVLLPADDSAGAEVAIGHPALERSMPYDLVIGSCNPLALPVRLEFDPPKASGIATFTAAYQGAPGCVHGAALAATFDIVLTAANAVAGAPGLTVRLNLRYRRPTLLDAEAKFEAWVTDQTSRRVHSLGRLIQGGEVTMEAEGEFAPIPRDKVHEIAAARRRALESHGETS